MTSDFKLTVLWLFIKKRNEKYSLRPSDADAGNHCRGCFRAVAPAGDADCARWRIGHV